MHTPRVIDVLVFLGKKRRARVRGEERREEKRSTRIAKEHGTFDLEKKGERSRRSLKHEKKEKAKH